jgi:GTP-binding protein SAR1
VFGNKCDVDCSVSESELRDALGLAYRQTRPMEVFMSSALNRYGYNAGLGWVSAFF